MERGELDDAVHEYVDAIARAYRPLFDRVHRLILEVHPDAGVVLSYGMRTYTVGRRRIHVGVWRHRRGSRARSVKGGADPARTRRGLGADSWPRSDFERLRSLQRHRSMA